MGKGSLWRVEQQYKQNLIQALTRSSYHPCTTSPTSSVEKVPSSYKLTPRPSESPPTLKVKSIFVNIQQNLTYFCAFFSYCQIVKCSTIRR